MEAVEKKPGKRRRLPGGTSGKRRPLPQRPNGRPTLLNKRMLNKICRLVSQGKPEQAAAQACGISDSTISGWYTKGCADIVDGRENIYVEFAEALNRARGQSVCSRMDKIDKACEGGQLVRKKLSFDKNGNEIVDETYTAPDWRGHAWVCETTRNDLFSKQRTVSHSGTVRHENINVNLSGKLDEAQLVALARLAHNVQAIPAESRPVDSVGQSQDASLPE